jgi:hypothetical protein
MQPLLLTMIVCEVCDHAHFLTGNAEEAGSSETLIINYKTTRPRVEVGSDFCFWTSEHVFFYSIIILPSKCKGISEDFIP